MHNIKTSSDCLVKQVDDIMSLLLLKNILLMVGICRFVSVSLYL